MAPSELTDERSLTASEWAYIAECRRLDREYAKPYLADPATAERHDIRQAIAKLSYDERKALSGEKAEAKRRADEFDDAEWERSAPADFSYDE